MKQNGQERKNETALFRNMFEGKQLRKMWIGLVVFCHGIAFNYLYLRQGRHIN